MQRRARRLDAISSCNSIVWKRFARRSITAPIMLPSSGVSSPLPMAVRMSPNCFGAFAWVRQRSRLEIDRDTRAHWHGPIDEDGQRGRVLLLRPGFEQSREGVGQFFRRVGDRNTRSLCPESGPKLMTGGPIGV